MSADQLINQSSGSFDYYTPEDVVELAREVLGHISLDPASCEIANKTVKANTYYDIEKDGLAQPWFGTMFMNPPFHKGENACLKPSKCKKKNCKPGKKRRGHHIKKAIPSTGDWTHRMVREFNEGNVEEAIIVTFSSMSEGWMIPLIPFLQCYPNGRINYRKPNGEMTKSVTKGTLITYMGPNGDKFEEVFSQLGHVK